MNIIELMGRLFKKTEEENLTLNDRIEFRINDKEKILIKKYCELRAISKSNFFRTLAMDEINNFINEKNI